MYVGAVTRYARRNAEPMTPRLRGRVGGLSQLNNQTAPAISLRFTVTLSPLFAWCGLGAGLTAAHSMLQQHARPQAGVAQVILCCGTMWALRRSLAGRFCAFVGRTEPGRTGSMPGDHGRPGRHAYGRAVFTPDRTPV
jgi:hypothetical protein